MKKSIDSLKKQVKMLQAGEGHMKMHMEDKTIAVLSVYDGQRAAHEILDELGNWAEETKNQELLDKIFELANLE